jgi:hypothetical protein
VKRQDWDFLPSRDVYASLGLDRLSTSIVQARHAKIQEHWSALVHPPVPSVEVRAIKAEFGKRSHHFVDGLHGAAEFGSCFALPVTQVC